MKEVSDEIHAYLEARGWVPTSASTIAKGISIEAAELLEHFQWDEVAFSDLDPDSERARKIRHELADVMIYCLQMARYLGVDAEDVVREKMRRQEEKYPVEKVRGMGTAYYEIRDAARSSDWDQKTA